MRQPDIHGSKRFIRPVTYGVCTGAVVCFLLLMLMAGVMSFRDVPQMAVSLISTLTFVAGGFAGGFACAALSRERGLLLGLCCGFSMFMILTLASLAFSEPELGIAALSKCVAVLTAAALGGIFGVNKRKKFK